MGKSPLECFLNQSGNITLASDLSVFNEKFLVKTELLCIIYSDEAQSLSKGVLDDLRILFNFKMDSENPFILILAGHPALRNRL